MKAPPLRKTAILLSLLAAPAAYAAPQLTLGTANVLQGRDNHLPLVLSGGAETYGGVNASVILPAGVSFIGVSAGPGLTKNGLSIYAQTTSNGGTFIAYSTSGAVSVASGGLLYLHLRVTPTASPGTYPVSFAVENPATSPVSSHALANADGTVSVAHTQTNGSITILADSDHDGMGDAWEITNFGSLTRAQATTDTDKDGMPDVVEFRAGTNPNNATSWFRVASSQALPSGTGKEFRLTWNSVAGGIYNVERSFDLTAWTKVGRNLEATPPLNSFADVANSPGGNAFYRLVLLEALDLDAGAFVVPLNY